MLKYKILPLIIFMIFAFSSVNAQYPDVAFIHGLDGTVSTWSSTANILETQRVYITPTNIAYNSDPSIVDIANSYQSNLPANSIGVAYSLGGLVSRRIHWQTSSTGQKISKLITVGTPHIGARAANAVNNGELFYMMRGWTYALALGPGYTLGGLFGFDEADGINFASNVLSLGISAYMNHMVNQMFVNRPVITDLKEGSAFTYAMNVVETMSGGTIPQARYAMWGDETYDGYNAHIRLAESEVNNSVENGTWYNRYRRVCNFYQYFTYYSLFLYYYNQNLYFQTGNFDYRMRADWHLLEARGWYAGYYNLAYIQFQHWSVFTGAIRAVNGHLYWFKTDGLLSSYAQAFPAFYQTLNRRISIPNHNHIEETKPTNTVLDRLTYALTRYDIGVLER